MPRFIQTGDEQRAERRRAFVEWLDAVDAHLRRRIGLGHRDLADQSWHDWFEDGLEPAEAAQQVLEEEDLV